MGTRKATKKLARGRPSSGYGILFEVRTALDMSQQETADFLGYSSGNTVARQERDGKTPRSRVPRHFLLQLAQRVPDKKRSEELSQWMNETKRALEEKPLGGVFL